MGAAEVVGGEGEEGVLGGVAEERWWGGGLLGGEEEVAEIWEGDGHFGLLS